MNNFRTLVFTSIYFLVTTSAFAQDSTGLKTSVSVDIAGEFSADKESDAKDKIGPRSVDVIFYAPVDHIFDGVLALAAHDEAGVSMFELHEAYIGSSKIIPNLSFKLGQYFLGIGRLNHYHRHEWPFITAPEVHARFFGDEGVNDSGLEISYLVPLPFYLDITIGATNGFVYGHAHDEGTKPITPMYYSHIKFFESIGELDIQPGITLLKRHSSLGQKMSLYGFDLTGKVKKGKTLVFLWQSELWQRILEFEGSTKQEISTGFYMYPQMGLTNGLEFGVRVDYLTVNTLKDATGNSVDNSEAALVPTLSFRPSEFSLLRASYKQKRSQTDGEDNVDSKTFEFQATYNLGAHPSHAF